MIIRRPYEKLAGCVWFGRIVDKTRHFLSGTLDQDYQRSFCNPKGIDGFFLRHFDLTGEEMIEAVKNQKNDETLSDWFVGDEKRAGKIEAWNVFATDLGKPDTDGEKMLQWALENVYTHCKDPRIDTAFKVLAEDEGYLDEYLETLS